MPPREGLAGDERRRSIDRLHPCVLPILMFCLLSGAASLLFGQLHAAREAARQDRFARVAEEAVELVQREIGTRLRLLAHLAAGMETGTLADAKDFSTLANDLGARFPGFVAINWVGPDRIITVVTPGERNAQALGRRLGQSAEVVTALDEAERARVPKATRLTDLFQGGKGVATYFPVWRDGAFAGYVNGVLAPAAILDDIQRVLEPAVRIGLAEAPPEQPAKGGNDRTYLRRIDVLNRAWTVTVQSDLFIAAPLANPDLWGLLVAVAFSGLASGFLFAALRGRRRALAAADRFADFADTSSDLLWEKDADLRFSFFSERLFALTGIRPASVLGRRPHDMPPLHTDPAAWRAHLGRLDAHESFRDFVLGFAGEDGAERYLRTSGRPRIDRRGRFLGYRGTATNVTAEVAAQTAAARAHDRLAQAVALMPAGFLLYDADEKVVVTNDAITQTSGIVAKPAPGTSMRDIVRAATAGRLGAADQAAIDAAVEQHLAALRSGDKDIERSYARGRWHRALDHRTPGGDLVCIRVDVTAQHLAAEALEAARAELKSILDNTIDGLITIDRDGTVLSFSKPAEWMFGHAATEMIGRDIRLLLPEIGSADPATLVGAGREVEGRTKDGAAIPIDLAVAELAGVASARRYVVTVRDIRGRKATEEQLRQAQKMEAVGQLTGGIAHDFNNLLQVILGNLEMLAETAATDGPASRQLAAARRAAQRGAELNRRLLAFSRRQALEPRPTDLRLVLDGLRNMLTRALGETVSLELAFAPDLAACLVDRNQMENALINLALNARDAMPGGGRIVVNADNHLVSQDDEDGAELASGRYVRLAISDCGIGMTEEARRRAFDPFFTTKAVGKGSGLGLSMVYGFAKQSGGHARIDSVLGRGTTVTLYLPQGADADTAADLTGGRNLGGNAAGAAAAPLSYRGRSVLVVEDEAAVRAWVTTQFAAFGFEVLEAASGPEARAALQGRAQLDLVFADVVLPGGSSGFELAAELRRVRPELKVIFSSGYAESEIERGGGPPPDSIMLAKPCRRADLAAAVHRALS